jgi:hypothetical protein
MARGLADEPGDENPRHDDPGGGEAEGSGGGGRRRGGWRQAPALRPAIIQ